MKLNTIDLFAGCGGLLDGFLQSNKYKSVASGEVKTLQTSMDIIEQHAAIKALLDLYESLVVKDAKDMDALVKEAEKMDQSIASTHRV